MWVRVFLPCATSADLIKANEFSVPVVPSTPFVWFSENGIHRSSLSSLEWVISLDRIKAMMSRAPIGMLLLLIRVEWGRNCDDRSVPMSYRNRGQEFSRGDQVWAVDALLRVVDRNCVVHIFDLP